MPGQLRLVLEHVQPSRPDGDQRQPRNFLDLPSIDLVLVEPGLPQTSGRPLETLLDLLDPALGAEGRDVGRLTARNDPLS